MSGHAAVDTANTDDGFPVDLGLARELVTCLEQGDSDGAKQRLDAMYRSQENSLFQELGKLTRQLHEGLNKSAETVRINELAKRDIPDAKGRLSYVLEKTDESTHRTLQAVESALPLLGGLQTTATALKESWRPAGDLQAWGESVVEFIGEFQTHGSEVEKNLNEVMMAQEYQDLTGQIITQVIGLVAEVEDRLVEIIRVTGQDVQVEEKSGGTEATGPRVEDSDDSVGGQDDVDDLLASMGF